MSEHANGGSDREVSRSVENRFFPVAVGLRDAGALQKLAPNNSRVSDWRLIDRNHVVRQTVVDDEPALKIEFGNEFGL